MAIFQDLPGELILEILHHTYLPELESVARVNHTLRNLARPILRNDLDLQSKVTKVTQELREVEREGRALVLYDILTTPRIAHYVRILDLRDWFIPWEVPVSEFEAQGAYNEYSDGMMDAFRQAVTVGKLIPSSLKGMWIRKIKQGDEAPIMASLCMMLPNLTLLRIDTRAISNACFQSYLQYVLSPASAGRAKLAEVFVDDYWADPFNANDDDTQELSASIILACQQPPHGPVDYLDNGAGARVVGDISVQRQLSPTAYNRLSVNLGDNALNVEVTKNLLGCANELREFHYASENGWAPVASYLYTICDYLQTVAKETLHVLSIHGTFTSSEPREGLDGNLGGFNVLHTVELVTCFLLDASGHFLISEFPESIRSIKLHNDLSDDCPIYYELLDDLLEEKIERLPNLQTLAIDSLEHMFEELSDSHYTTSMKSVGVELILKKDLDMPMEGFHNPAIFSSSSRA